MIKPLVTLKATWFSNLSQLGLVVPTQLNDGKTPQ